MIPRRTVLTLLALAPCLLVACAPGEPAGGASTPGGRLKLGFLVKQPEEPWFQLEWQFAEEAARELDFELLKIGIPDGERTLAAIDSLAAQGAAGFVICTPDVRLGPAIVARARQHRLKLIAVDDQFLGADGQPMRDVHYLGISARAIGQTVGRLLLEEGSPRAFDHPGVGILAVTYDELETARERTEGALEVLAKAPGIHPLDIVRVPVRKPEIAAAMDAVDIVLTQRADIQSWLVCGMNDNCVLGAVRALEGRGFSATDVIAIGINGTDCLDELEKPTPTGFLGSILLSARQHGRDTITMLQRWCREGVEPPLDTRTTGVLITRANFRQVLKEQGLSR